MDMFTLISIFILIVCYIAFCLIVNKSKKDDDNVR